MPPGQSLPEACPQLAPVPVNTRCEVVDGTHFLGTTLLITYPVEFWLDQGKMAPAVNRRRVLAAILLLRRLRRRRRSMWVHPINEPRLQYGAYYHLVAELQLYPEKHHDYFRMSAEKMEELLSIVGPEIQRLDTNYRKSIEPKQRLAVTIR
ncbi:hypothetical protein WMY93_001917 [Mugilogobius chulae]|uniref:Uncharacterized protein n=1 Tax=Mugilogobius chulae TaxID=88201 RepID=A0AAW0PS68_9GOBI